MPGKKIIKDVLFEDIHVSGKAVCRHKGLSIFIPFAIPGEKADIIIDSYKPFAKGHVVRLTESSPNRTEPFCQYYTLCGGCNWQHIEYRHQLKLKRQILEKALNRNTLVYPGIPDVIASQAQREYRFKMEYSFSDSRWFYDDEGKIEDPSKRCALGFHLADKPDRVVDIEKCEMQPSRISEIIRGIKKIALEQNLSFYNYRYRTGSLKSLTVRITSKNEIMLSFIFNEDDVTKQNCFLKKVREGFREINSINYSVTENNSPHEFICFDNSPTHVTEYAIGIHFHTGSASFYQPNAAQAEKIFSKIADIAGLKGGENIYDLYCGVGTISLHLARNARHVTGIEGSAEAVEYAKQNALLNKNANTTFIHGDVLETFNNDFIIKHGKPDIVVLDPPRAGTLIEIKKMILNTEPEKIIYLSCDPLSLANDLKMLCGKYHITFIQPYDMLPHTHQMETLVMLEKS